MVPFRHAVDTLITGFNLGVNVVHAAADYAGSLDVVSEAIQYTDRHIYVCSNGWGNAEQFKGLFEDALERFGKRGPNGKLQLDFYGIASVEDRELLDENVWYSGGMVEFLLEQKRKGRLLHTFCTSHGSPGYIQRLIESDVFDAVMFAYNPLGFHILSFNPPDDRGRESLHGNEALIKIAASRDIGVMLMEVLAGGLLSQSNAYSSGIQDRQWEGSIPPLPTAREVLRYILKCQPNVSCLLPGTASAEEARENALAGHGTPLDTGQEGERIAAAVDHLHATICQRCGKCEETCSERLPISWLFRAADINERGAVPFETPADKLYFDLHPPADEALCVTCEAVTCHCPLGLDIPSLLTSAHQKMRKLLHNGEVPGPTRPLGDSRASYDARLIASSWNGTFATVTVQNSGHCGWHTSSTSPAVSLELRIHEGVTGACTLRADVPIGEFAYFSLEFTSGGVEPAEIWMVFSGLGEELPTNIKLGCLGGVSDQEVHMKSDLAARYVSHDIPTTLRAGARCEAWIELENTGWAAWNGKEGSNNVDLTLCIGDILTTFVIQNEVRPHGRIRVPIRFDVPGDAELTSIKADLVCQNRAFFSQLGSEPLILLLNVESSDGISLVPAYAVEFLQHRAPSATDAKARVGLWVRIRNQGAMRWDPDNSAGQQVSTVVTINGQIVATAILPHSVATSQLANVHLVVPVPATPGLHTVEVNLVHEGVAFFNTRGVEPLKIPLMVRARETIGADLYEVALRSNSSFYHLSGGLSRLSDGTALPQFVERAKGCYVWDLSGRSYIDYIMGWGCALLGYSHDLVEAAARRTMGCGPTLPLPHRLEMELTNDLCQQAEIPCAEAVAFGKNGSDVCTLAIRLARIATGRNTVVVCGYHGWQDWYAEQLGFSSTGVPSRDPSLVIRVPQDDPEALRVAIARHRGDLAAVMLEPSGAAGGTRMVGGDADPAHLALVATETRKAGALLIFDEIITGFRYPKGSVQQALGIVPDLACFGKALGNGFPISALVGRRDLMGLMSRTFYGPTFKGELYSLAAARAALSIYRSEPVADHVWRYGKLLQAGIAKLCKSIGVDADVAGPPFRFVLHFNEPDLHRRNLIRTLYLQELLRGGLITYNGVMLPSFAHDEIELTQTLSVIEKALNRVHECAAGGEVLHRAVEVPPVRTFM
jgi:glutamate-1-semialdehyde aminotransferase/predicted aldo/keto reductase-like oxidoreductase